jgi:hypothetical protein
MEVDLIMCVSYNRLVNKILPMQWNGQQSISDNQYLYMYNLNLSSMIDLQNNLLSITLRIDLLSITLQLVGSFLPTD